jgi:hypothetical protein
MKLSKLMFLALSSVLGPCAMAASAPPTSGLLITHVNSQQWQIRLISDTAVERFSGVVDSSLPITAVHGLQLEADDSAKLLTPTSLGAALGAWPGRSDGVSFTVGTNAKLCLRDTGSSGVHIYLGDSLQDAIAVTAPAALAGANPCDTTTEPPPPPPGTRKFHAGHWIVMGRGDDNQTLMATTVKPGVVGIVKRYTWRSLEPTQNTYDFSAIKSDLAWSASNGMRLIVLIEYKTFRDEKAGPAYLDAYEGRNNMGGFSMVLWSPVVVARYNALVKALGAQVDSDKNFEGIATQESAMSMDGPVLQAFTYTPEKYRDALISMLSSATVSLPTSRVFWLMNFIVGNQAYIGDIASAVASKGVVMGGPDVWPDNRSLQSRTYPFYTQFYGKMPLFGQVENVCYSEPHMTGGFDTKYWTMPELFNYARTQMHVDYMFWVRITRPANSGAYDWEDALPVIAATPNF